MAIKDWQITISRQTRAISQAGFGKVLILATDSAHPFTTYTELEDVSADFDETTEAYAMANRILGQTPRPTEIAIMGVEYDNAVDEPTTLVSALNDTKEEYYFLTCQEQGSAEITALSEWVDAQQKLYGVSTDDETVLEGLESDRTIVMVHSDPTSYPCEAWIGKCASFDPGSITWNYQPLNGLSASDVDEDAVKEAGGNTYIEQHGNLHTYDGQVTSGEWIDVMRSQDFLYTRIDESVFGTLLRADKVPYTNAGIAMIEAAIEAPIMEAAQNDMIATDEDGQFMYSVNAPTRSETTANDRADRLLPNIQANVTLAGAVHGGDIEITIEV
ncbi:Protein of unknown function [Alteribacillus persepolensis]|uniref:DUF3383 family protein n=1 Tax=Alteribacillus persepolensis TaxID=568899 RepID=A0A1G8IAX2_9BACI|nr:DUF3383 family protein [Alteribacillus persepolensis]SDI15977.1 Protein of unknown function [Alteribacillus persepolensis]